MTWRVAAIGALLLGCSEAHDSAPCSGDAGCGAGNVCLRPDGHPATYAPRCDPTTGLLCSPRGTCVAAGTTFGCWTAGTTPPGGNCADDYDCAPGFACSAVSNTCFPVCNSTTDCPLGLYCGGGACVSRCVHSSQCPSNSLCYGGTCVAPITAFTRCPMAPGGACDAGTVCNPLGGADCVDPETIGCLSTPCPAGRVCFTQCVPSHE